VAGGRGARFARSAALLLLPVLALAACSSASTGNAGSGPGAVVTATLPAPEVVSAVPDAIRAEYRIGPLDLLEISVFRVPELGKTVKVNASGAISMPLIGAVQAGGKTVSELEAEIASKLEGNYLQSAEVSVFVKEANSQQVTVDGAVSRPGLVPLSGQTTLLQTIAISGGLTTDADPRGILVFRTVNQQRSVAKFDLKAIRAGKADDPKLYGGDVVVVDTSALRSAYNGVKEALPVFGMFTAAGTL
jgi:polysaccharide export outer membrane protein